MQLPGSEREPCLQSPSSAQEQLLVMSVDAQIGASVPH